MMRRFFATWSGLLFIVFTVCASPGNGTGKPSQKQVLRKIIIDPGHGGTDVGATGRYSTEKDISLSISLKLDSMIRQEIPEVET